jgi:hypothetical protein
MLIDDDSFYIVYFEIIPFDVDRIAYYIWDYSNLYATERDGDRDVLDRIIEEMREYEDGLDGRHHNFPELIDGYYANLINGAYYSEYDEVALFEEFRKYPEREFGYWLSPFSKSIGEDFYVSTDAWIVPQKLDYFKALEASDWDVSKLKFSKADFLLIGDYSYLVNDDQIVFFRFDYFLKAKICTSIALNKEPDELSMKYDFFYLTFSYDRISDHFKNEYSSFLSIPSHRFEYFLSEFSEIALVKDGAYTYIFFELDKVEGTKLLSLTEMFSKFFKRVSSKAGITSDIRCDWGKIDGESFEQLCYDIIYYNSKFDNRTIRKMGKSKSRDGGRDIEVYTHARPGRSPLKYIFQCKYQKPGTSLTGSKLRGVSDTIDQYGADGYGVMTSVVIDPTLYDKLDGISKNREIKLAHWSVYEIERFLVSYPDIKKRYFED